MLRSGKIKIYSENHSRSYYRSYMYPIFKLINEVTLCYLLIMDLTHN